jgi:hypothetical protein
MASPSFNAGVSFMEKSVSGIYKKIVGVVKTNERTNCFLR